ncbi:class I SAM-dependent methyltransferase [Roseobacter sp. CCS2]|uniref:class I SAM-dependent methyltransferase n=1 Tax=Roseobacter sp. CCS2 TaxID=391593 RepID=UPI0012E9994B|nr:class I SAM-dependent methyltransferase [Roseobacter sp. CCS2]
MAIDSAFGIQLIKARSFVADKSSAVMLGRQSLKVRRGERRYFKQALRAADLPLRYSHYQQEDGYSETFFDRIGFPPVISMDASPYEGCDIAHDLNDPLPDDLHSRFDVVIDGGTIEHIFNTPQSLDNVFHMLKDDGIFISINGMTGWAGHGFYQFSPELVWRYWQDTRRCAVETCAAVCIDPAQPTIHVADTGKGGVRFRSKGLGGRWYLYYVIRKLPTANAATQITKTHQGDYTAIWNKSDKAQTQGADH